MEALHIKPTEDVPEVILNQEKEIFEISGMSLPEDVNTFYEPVLNWINLYTRNPNPLTIFNFRFTYFNTATSKIILDILTMLEEMVEAGHNVVVRWHFAERDEDMHEAGEEFSEMVGVPFELVTYKRK
jgi:SiaC family regulatory phosphoprotein